MDLHSRFEQLTNTYEVFVFPVKLMQNINYNLEVDGNHAIPTDAYKAPVFLVKLIDLKVTKILMAPEAGFKPTFLKFGV